MADWRDRSRDRFALNDQHWNLFQYLGIRREPWLVIKVLD